MFDDATPIREFQMDREAVLFQDRCVNRLAKLGLTHFWCSCLDHAVTISRGSSKSSLARPYICRLTSLSRVP